MTRPLFNNSNLTVFIFLVFTVLAKHTFIFPEATSNGTTLFFCATSKEK